MRHQAGTGKALPMAGPEHHHVGHHFPWRDRNTKFAGPPCHGRTETSTSPDLPAYGRTENIKFAGPPCLWPDRETNLRAPRRTSLPMAGPATRLELTKLLNGGKGCSRRKHGYRKESGSRALLAFPLPLALYARVLSKPG